MDYGNGLQIWDGSGGMTGTGNNAGASIGLHPDIPVTGTYIITDSTTGAGNWQLKNFLL